MKKTRLLTLLVLLLTVATGAWAGLVTHLVLNTADGQTVVALADQPVITVADGMLVVKKGGAEVLSVALDKVRNYSFADDASTGIKEALAGKGGLKEGHVYMTQVKAGEVIDIFAADGRRVGSQRVSADGLVDVDLTAQPKGVYIVKSPTTSFKVFNK
ncbi:MAG: hypothetical protein J6X59_06920 [Bacteroidales bacterium]|nr:hypothetical protein [Bacteroidales bacterium]